MGYKRAFVSAGGIILVAGALSVALSKKSAGPEKPSPLEIVAQSETLPTKDPRDYLPSGYKDILCSLEEIRRRYTVTDIVLASGQASMAIYSADRDFGPHEEQFEQAVAFLHAPVPKKVHLRVSYAGRTDVKEDVALPVVLGINLHYDTALELGKKEQLRKDIEQRFGLPSATQVVDGNFHLQWGTTPYVATLSNSAEGKTGEIISLSLFNDSRAQTFK